MAETVWLQVNGGEYGPDSRAWHVEVGSEVHKRLVAEGAHEVAGPDGPDGSDDGGGDLSTLKVAELKQLAADRGLDVQPNARKADLVALLEQDGDDQGTPPGDNGDGDASPDGGDGAPEPDGPDGETLSD